MKHGCRHLRTGVTRYEVRPLTFHPHDKLSTHKGALLQIWWWRVHRLHPAASYLQEAADTMYVWTIPNNMTINQIRQKSLLLVFLKQSQRIDGIHNQRVTEAKILGTAIASNLIWVVHVDEITEKQAIGFSAATTQTIRYPRWRSSDCIHDDGPAYTGILISNIVDLTHFRSSRWYNTSTKKC